jgi:hypothetical protein
VSAALLQAVPNVCQTANIINSLAHFNRYRDAVRSAMTLTCFIN